MRKEWSDRDIELADGTGDDENLDALERGICGTLSAAQPDLAIHLAAADPCPIDRLGRLALSMEGLLARDRADCELCGAAPAPVAVATAGGYARNISDTSAFFSRRLRRPPAACAPDNV